MDGKCRGNSLKTQSLKGGLRQVGMEKRKETTGLGLDDGTVH